MSKFVVVAHGTKSALEPSDNAISAGPAVIESKFWDLVEFKNYRIRRISGIITPTQNLTLLSPDPINHYLVLETQVFTDSNYTAEVKDSAVQIYLDDQYPLGAYIGPFTSGRPFQNANNINATLIITSDPTISVLSGKSITLRNATTLDNSFYYRLDYIELDGTIQTQLRTIGILDPMPNTAVQFYSAQTDVAPFPLGYDNKRGASDNSNITFMNGSASNIDSVVVEQNGNVVEGIQQAQVTNSARSLFPQGGVFAETGDTLSVNIGTSGTLVNSGIFTTVQLV